VGYYINKDNSGNYLPSIGKADHLIEDGATKIEQPTEWQPDLVCVVENGLFDAAAYAFDEREMHDFFPNAWDQRDRTWLIVPNAAKLAGYNPRGS
jgi:hypothetical protein